jgi:hypothetical protein
MGRRSPLRGQFGHEFFSHQVVQARTYGRKCPEWTQNDKQIAEVIRQVFPRWDTTQKTAAARWALVIHLYFRMGYTRSQIAEETGSTTEKIKGVIRSIYRASQGRRADGRGLRKGTCP